MATSPLILQTSANQAESTPLDGVGPGLNGSPTIAATVLDDFPQQAEALRDWSWVFEQREKGAFEGYQNRHVAVIARQIVGSGPDPAALRNDAVKRFQVDPERVVVFFVHGADFSVP